LTETRPNSPKTALKIVWHAYDGFAGLTYTLNCDPASGTLPDPAAACAEISRYPGMVFEGASYAGSCGQGPPSSGLSVSGKYEARRVKVEFFTCSEGDAYEANWKHVLPTEKQENEVGIDRAIGPFALGATRASVEALLSSFPAASAGNLAVYHPWESGSSACGVPRDGEPSPILAIGYDGKGRVTTLIADQNRLAIGGRAVWSLLVRCAHTGPEDLAHSEGSLRDWTTVRCGGLDGVADRPLGEAPKGQATTILGPEWEPDQFSFTIVASKPTSACEDVARLRAEPETQGAANGATRRQKEEPKPLTEEAKKKEEEEKAITEAKERQARTGA
jgi:hypothetical protein